MSSDHFNLVSDKIKVFAFPFLIAVTTFFLIGFYNNQSDLGDKQDKTNSLLLQMQRDISDGKSDFRSMQVDLNNYKERTRNVEDRVNSYEKIFIEK